MYAVTSQGAAASGSASTTVAVYIPPTVLAAVTSRENRLRKSALSASSGRISLIAISRPPGDRPRYTRPMPPLPSLASSRYLPIC